MEAFQCFLTFFGFELNVLSLFLISSFFNSRKPVNMGYNCLENLSGFWPFEVLSSYNMVCSYKKRLVDDWIDNHRIR